MCAAYGAVVPLSAAENERLGRWAAETPGATWPSWGGHVTVLPSVEVGGRDSELANAIDEVAQRTKPFRIALGQPAPKAHAFSPGDWTVQLVIDHAAPLRDLRSELWRAVDPIGVDLYPDAREDWYEFHLSLIGRGSRADAEGVAEAQLTAEFTADSIELVAHPASGRDTYRVSQRFAFGSGR